MAVGPAVCIHHQHPHQHHHSLRHCHRRPWSPSAILPSASASHASSLCCIASPPRPRCLVLSLLSSALPMPSSTAASAQLSPRFVLIIIGCTSPCKSVAGCISTIIIAHRSYFLSSAAQPRLLDSACLLAPHGISQRTGSIGPMARVLIAWSRQPTAAMANG